VVSLDDAVTRTRWVVDTALDSAITTFEDLANLIGVIPPDLQNIQASLAATFDVVSDAMLALGTAPGLTPDQVNLYQALGHSIDNVSRLLSQDPSGLASALGDLALDLHDAVRSGVPSQSIGDNLQQMAFNGQLLTRVVGAYMNAPDGSLTQQAMYQAARILVADMAYCARDILRGL